MRRVRLIWYLFPFFLLITSVVLVAVTWYAARSWRLFFLEQTTSDLKTRVRLVEAQLAGGLAPENRSRVDKLCKDLGKMTSTRLTVILPSGLVLGDSDKDPAKMENHADRPEFQTAMKGREGHATRYSFTLGHTRLYVAMPVRAQGAIVGVVRASLAITDLEQALGGLYGKMALGGLVIALVVTALSFFLVRSLTKPLEDLKRGAWRFAKGELSRKLPVPQTEELAGLAEALNEMATQLQERLNALTRQGQLQEAVFSSMIEGVVAIDTEQKVIILNRAAAQLLGVSPDQAEARTIQEVVTDPQLRWFINRTQFIPEPLEEEVAFKEGAALLQAHGTSLLDAAGQALGTLIVLYDVTHLKHLERARRDFVANVSHELKTPITSIKGFVENLLAGALHEPDNAFNFLRIIARQTDRLNEIINDLLSLSRIEQDAERGQIYLTTDRVKGVLEEALQVCGPKAAEKNIRVTLSCPDPLRARISAPLLEQAVVNLVDNAIKYSPEDSVIQVEAERTGPEVVIRVRDQGRGIAKEHLPRLFERFYRVDAGRSRKLGGTGLGLAIVKHIAQAHGGKVMVASTPEKGSVFSLHLFPD
jgi:two-component system phosphate regulon sensor histidine kinase PhoR